jgi:hypothetical protein
VSAIGGISSFNLPSPWQQLQNMDAAISTATSGNTDSNATIVSMLSGGGTGSSAADTVDAISSAMASAETSSFQGYAQLAAQAALKRVQDQAKAAQAASGAADASAAPAANAGPDTPDPLNPSDPTNPFAAQAPVTLDDGTVIKPPSGVDLGNGASLDPSTGITTMADGTQVNSFGVPVKEISTLPVDQPGGIVDVMA